MAMLSQLQVVLRLVIVDLVVHKEVGRLALVDRAPAVTVGTVAKNLSLGSRGAEEPAKNLRLSCRLPGSEFLTPGTDCIYVAGFERFLRRTIFSRGRTMALR